MIASIDARKEGIGPEGGKLIGEALRGSVSTSLTRVNLLGNKFDDAAVAMLLKAKEEKPALASLCGLSPGQARADFRYQDLTPACARLLAAEIAASTSLTSCDVRYNDGLGEEGGRQHDRRGGRALGRRRWRRATAHVIAAAY